MKPIKETASGKKYKFKLQDPSHLNKYLRLEERVPTRGWGAARMILSRKAEKKGLKGKKVYLVFFRYSACIVCRLRVSQCKKRVDELKSNNMVVIPVFESTLKEMKSVGRNSGSSRIVKDACSRSGLWLRGRRRRLQLGGNRATSSTEPCPLDWRRGDGVGSCAVAATSRGDGVGAGRRRRNSCVRLTTKHTLPRLAREEYTPGHRQGQHQDHQGHDPDEAELDLQTMIDFR